MRWRDVQWVEFEPPVEAPAPSDPAPTDGYPLPVPDDQAPAETPPQFDALPEPQSEPQPEPEPEPEPASRQQRREAADAPAPIEAASPPPARRRTLPTDSRALRFAAIVLVAGAAALVVYRGGHFGAGQAMPAAVPLQPPAALDDADGAPPPRLGPRPREAPDRLARLRERSKAGDAAAQYELALAYARGDGVTQDYARAASLFREAAISDDIRAQFDLAVMYEEGLGLSRNMNEALIWYHSAAARNYAPAEYNLAVSYAEGRGAPADMVAAARWYLRAAAQGVVPAMINFAILCETGQGTEQSSVTAYAWYRAAAARDDKDAAKRADDLWRHFSDAERRKAEAAETTIARSIRQSAAEPLPLTATNPQPP